MLDKYFNNSDEMNFDFLPRFNFFHDEEDFNPFENLNNNSLEGFSFEKQVPFKESNPFENVELIPVLESKDIPQNENQFLIRDENLFEEHNELGMVLDENDEQENQINEEVIPNVESNEKLIFDITKEDKRNHKVLPKYPRIDDYKIFIRAKVNKYYISLINELITQSDLPVELKKKIHSPSYKKFTEKVKCSSTLADLQKSMNYILILGYETQKNQRQNRDNIQAIFNHYMNHPSEKVGKIIEMLNMTYERVIEEFYNSQAFNAIKGDDVAKFYDEEFKRQKHFSLFEKNGLIRLFKSHFPMEGKDQSVTGKKRKSSNHP